MSLTTLREIEGLPEAFISGFFPHRPEGDLPDRKTLYNSCRVLCQPTGEQSFVAAPLASRRMVGSTGGDNHVILKLRYLSSGLRQKSPKELGRYEEPS